MSRRTSEANKAIAKAWENERQNVLEGKGTRNWTPEQQKDIIENGKAHDENGRAFEGQHMKSVGEYPEYQGEPGNIQFLTREEHLEAHMGSWQNPTNWYYDPVTKEINDFGTNPFTPCEVFELKDPIVSSSNSLENRGECKGKETETAEKHRADNTENAAKTQNKPSGSLNRTAKASSSSFSKIRNGIGKATGFLYQHREGIKTGLKVVGGIALGAVVDHVAGGRASSGGGHDSDYDYSPSESENSFERSSPSEHVVPGHKQRYHTKDGVGTREKAPYKRGGKNDD